jgi:hypothetical protein
MTEPVFTPEALVAIARSQALRYQIQVLVGIERDLEWICHDCQEDLLPAVEPALAGLRTTTRVFRQALGRLEDSDAPLPG